MKQEHKLSIQKILPSDDILFDESMKKHTTLHIGGNADCLVMPRTTEDIQKVITFSKEHEIPYYVIGNGSNLLVSDDGFRGIIIKIWKNYSQINFETKHRVTAQAGVMLSKLATLVSSRGLTGFEYAVGIPGTLGGAVAMNAGAYGGDIKQTIVGATVLTKNGDILTLSKEELKLGYRTSSIQDEEYLVLDATFEFEEGDITEIYDKITEYTNARREKQPLEKYSAGSTFKRPQGYFTGKLIMDSGLRGYQVGGAQVSEKHCGFVVNLGDASAEDFLRLIRKVQNTVYENYQVMLEPEVKMLGVFQE